MWKDDHSKVFNGNFCTTKPKVDFSFSFLEIFILEYQLSLLAEYSKELSRAVFGSPVEESFGTFWTQKSNFRHQYCIEGYIEVASITII